MSESGEAKRSVPVAVVVAAGFLGFTSALALMAALLRGAWASGTTWAVLVVGAGYLALSVYLYRGRRWAWILVLVLCGVGLGAGLVELSNGGNGVVEIVACVLYTVLLTLPATRRYFARPTR
jgi:hypothetical protein